MRDLRKRCRYISTPGGNAASKGLSAYPHLVSKDLLPRMKEPSFKCDALVLKADGLQLAAQHAGRQMLRHQLTLDRTDVGETGGKQAMPPVDRTDRNAGTPTYLVKVVRRLRRGIAHGGANRTDRFYVRFP